MSLQLMLVDARYEQQSIFLYAVDERGDHYTVQVDDFYPYFYVEPPSPAYDGHEIRRNLERLLDEKMPRSIQRPFIRDVEPIRKHKLLGYNFTKEPTDMYRFTMNSPAAIQKARKFLEHGLATNRTPCDTHEANVAFVMRFLVDHHLSGCGWFTVPIRPPELHHLHVSHVDVRSAAHLRDNIAPMTWLSFDIEASRVHNGGRGFVEPQYDPVTQIGCTLFNPARDLQRVVFCYCYEKEHGVSPLPPAHGQEGGGIEKRIYYSEAEMLLAFRSYIVQHQVDVITGYNINAFDLPYLFDRAKTLGIADQFAQFSRTGADRPAYLKKTTFTSKAFGTRESFQLYCDGRFTFDMYQYVARQKKFRSYQLGSVAMQILKEPKVEMDYKLIPQFQAGTDEQRAHLAYYCWKDADLVAQLIRKLMVIPNNVEQCRVTGVPMAFLLSRGEQIKTFSKLLSLCATRNMVIPSSTESENDEDTQGALVFEPKRGLYKGKVIVLDFKSLYPSIMIWRNIGYSSLAPRSVLEAVPGWVEGVDYYIPPIPGCTWGFVSEKHYRCVLAEMEEDLLAARGKAKRDLKAETDPDRAQVLDGRQLALKLLCNSLYGFVKANMISEKRIMESVCAWGRELAETSKCLVETHFCQNNGYSMNCEVVYGDTDSIMVNFGEDITMEQAEEYAREAARLCTTHFGGAIELEFEKIYSPYLLQGKKRYAGYRYEGGNPPYVSSSGMETVRRDNAPIAPKTMNVMLDKILVQNDVPGAIAYAQTVVKELRMGKVPISDLIVTQSLSKSFKRYREKDTKLAHVELAERIRKRAHVTGEMPYATGDRVKYILAKRDKKAKKFEQVEDPMYALENGVPLDYDAYVEKQLMKPICRIMTPIVGKKQRYKRLRPQDEEDIELPAEDTVRYNAKGEKKQLTPGEWKKLTAYKLIFEGEHMRTKKVRTSSTAGKAGSGGGGVKHFFKVQRRCQVCKTLLPPSRTAPGQSGREESLYCDRCSASSARETDQAAKQAQLATLQERQGQIWRGCIVDCAKGNEELARACDNRDCPQLYARKQIVMDIEELDKLTH